jgi:hypothetical protein
VREFVVLEVDGTDDGGAYSDITTFDNSADQFEDGIRAASRTATTPSSTSAKSRNKGSCIAPGFRANDFQLWSRRI